LLNQLTEILRYSNVIACKYALYLPLSITGGDNLARHQLIGHVHHEQGIAIRALMDCSRQAS